jgi:hypothetical protein
MLRITIAVSLFFCIQSTNLFAQSNSPGSTLHAQALILEDGYGHSYSFFVPQMQTNMVYTLPLVPPALPTAGYVGQGLSTGQTLSWNGSSWMPSSVLINDGTNLIASGAVNAVTFVGNGFGLTSLNAAVLNGIVPLSSLSGITSAQLASNAAITDGQITSISAYKITGPLPNLNGSNITSLSPGNLSPGTAAISITGNAATATTAQNLSGTITEAQVTNLATDLAAKANDASVVHNTGAESIGGVKTFTNTIAGNITGNAATATSAASLTGSISESQVTNLTSDLAARALDATVVHLTGDQTIAGIKTFSAPIVTDISGSASSITGNISESQVTGLATDLLSKAINGSVVHLTGDESIAGIKTFASTIQGNISGSAGSAISFSGNIAESQVTGLTTDLSAKATDASVVHLTGAESIAGVKTFTSTIQGNISGSAGSATSFSGNIAESQVTGLTTDLSAKAMDASVVHLAGAESIAGVKTFTSTIQGNIAGSAGSAVSFSGNIPESQVTGLTTDLSAKATDASVVHLTGAESIAGVKTFTSTIQGNISGSAGSATSFSGNIAESQVTGLTTDLSAKAMDASVVHLAGAESIAGVKTFTSTIQGNISGSAGSATSFSGNIPESQVTGLTTDLSAKAMDASVVHLAGAESIAGVKTFTSTIQGNISGSAGSATSFSGNIPESQVTGLTADLAALPTNSSVMHLTGNESIAGVKTFTSTIQGNLNGNASTATDGLTSVTATAPLSMTLNSKVLTASISAATASAPGSMSASDKAKLDAITGTNTGDQTITLQGDVTGAGTGLITAALSTTGITGGTYTKLTVDNKGRATAGAQLASADIPSNAANTTGTAANVTGIVAVANGGTGTSTGSITPTGNYSITQNTVAVLTSESASAAANTFYLKQGNVGIGQVPTAKLDVNGTAQMTGFKMATGAASTYVLTSDVNGVGTWQAVPSGGSGGSLTGGTASYVPLWSSASALTSSLIYQSSGQLGIGNTLPGATLDVTGSGKYSGLLTANGGITRRYAHTFG